MRTAFLIDFKLITKLAVREPGAVFQCIIYM